MRFWRIIFTCFIFIATVFPTISQPIVFAAASPWIQNNWTGGSGQSMWTDTTKYSSSSTVTTTSANQITIASNSNWYDTSWKYRKSVSVSNSSGLTLSDYQIPVFLDTSSLISSLKMKSDCSDIRVADANGNSLSYWIATSPSSNTCNQTNTKIWVKASSISASGSTLYIYYGNSSASSQSSGGDVFAVFADFTSGSSLPTGWVKTDIGTSGSAVVDGGVLTISNTNGGDVWNNVYGATHAYNNTTVSGSFIAETFITSQTYTNIWAKSGLMVENSIAANTSNGQAFIVTTPGNGIAFQYQSVDTYNAADLDASGGSYSLPVFLRLTKNESNAVSGYFSSDGSSWSQQGSTVNPIGISSDQYVALFTTPHEITAAGSATFTFFYTRKYSDSEPSIGTPGSEQTTYVSSGTLVSSVYDTEQASNYGTLTYMATVPTNTSVAVKVRTSDSSDMTGATDFSSCTAVTSGSDISSNNCVSDGKQYIQYQIGLSNSDGVSSPTFQSISIGYDPTFSPTPSPTVGAVSSSSGSSVASIGSSSCNDAKPVGKPDLFQIDTAENYATIYFTPVSHISKYYISYSIHSSAEEYGAEVSLGDAGVQNYTVNSLSPETMYYFKIRSQNGCMPGDWSNIKTAATKKSPSNFASTVIEIAKEKVMTGKKMNIISHELTNAKSNLCSYTVNVGDSLWSIASDKLGDGLRSADLKELNNLETNALSVGRELKLPCTKEEKNIAANNEEAQRKGIKLDVLVKDSDNKPLEGVTVTLHSKVQTGKTNKEGIARFENVEPGEHRVLLSYNNYNGEQKLIVDKSQPEQTLTLQVQMNNGFSSPFVLGVLGVMAAVIVLLIVILYIKTKSKNNSYL